MPRSPEFFNKESVIEEDNPLRALEAADAIRKMMIEEGDLELPEN